MVSLSDFFKCPLTLDKFYNCGYLSSYLDPFATRLAQQQFSNSRLRVHITNVAHLSHSLKGNVADIYDLNEHIYTFLYKHIPICKCVQWKQARNAKQILSSLNRFKTFLSDYRGINFNFENQAYEEIHNQYLCWLSEIHKLDNSSIELRSNYLKQFLKWYKDTSNYKLLYELKPYDIESFFIKASSQWGTSYKRSLQGTLRSFFDFCHQQGHTSQNLRSSLPVIKTYRLSKTPKKIDDNEAVKLLESIDRSNDSGKRAYAIVLVLYTYGVRGCQIRALKLRNIDWHKEEIHFPSVKGGKSCSFPLTAEVGNALLDYLQNVRHKSQYNEFFLTLRAPFTPLRKSMTLSTIIKSAMLKADIKSPSKGAHCFRHGFVSRMLNQGESFKHIADLVGHKHIQTTFIYTKIDFNSLTDVALELPEVEYENC